MPRLTLLASAILILVAVFLFAFEPSSDKEGQEATLLPYTRLLQSAQEGEITSVLYREGRLEGITAAGAPFLSHVPQDPALFSELRAQGVEITVEPPEEGGTLSALFFAFGPTLLIVFVLLFLFRRMASAQSRPDPFARNQARLLSDSDLPPVRFEDAAGIDEAKAELEEIVQFLRDPQRFDRVGGKIPKGILLAGPPGTGKTLLARAIAGEAEVPFYSLSGSSFVEMYVGVGASRVRDLFAEAKQNAPCLVFIDEIDAVGRHRGAGVGGGNDEREQTLNQLLVEMDGFEANAGIILIAATNRPDILDEALLRPGRFDRQVIVPRPDVRGREKILRVHSEKVPLSPDVNLEKLARSTPGFSGADLANLVNEAALLAAREDRYIITNEHLERARDKVTMGAERRSMVITEKEKRITACHEAGHTLAALLIPGSHPVHKVSIIPRGMALGVTLFRPEEELHNETRTGAQAGLCALLAGRVAEEIVCGDVTSGASNDIQRATSLARQMVCEWGMSDALGLMALGQSDEGTGRAYSEATALRVDEEIRSILDQSYRRTRAILEENRSALDRLTEALVDRETLDEEEIREVVFGKEEAA